MNWLERINERFRDKERAMAERKQEKTSVKKRGPVLHFKVIRRGLRKVLVAIKK